MPRKTITDMIPDIDVPEPEPDGAKSPPGRRGASRPRKTPGMAPRSAAPAPDTELDTETLGRWRWQLSATARKAAAARARSDAAMTAWERLVADAEAAGVPGRLVVAAAADAGIDAPGAS